MDLHFIKYTISRMGDTSDLTLPCLLFKKNQQKQYISPYFALAPH